MLDTSWILTILVALVTWFLTSQWLKIRSLPSGPLPLPVLGNILHFRFKSFNGSVEEFRRKYGGIFTIWLGSVPFVVVSDHRLIREGLLEKKNDFAGRQELPLFSKFVGENIGFAVSDYSRPWEILRKTAFSAIRKYATSERLPPLVDELTEEAVQKMLKQDQPFNTRSYIYALVFNVVGSNIVGQRFQETDPTFMEFRRSVEIFQKFLSSGMLGYFMPILKPFFRRNEKEMIDLFVYMQAFMTNKIKEHISTYQRNDLRDMIDSLLCAREEAVAEFGAENTPHLTDGNIYQIIMDIFGASIDTTSNTLHWLILYVTMYPEIQEKMIQEISDNIGDRIPTQDDRRRCPYTSAVISETMRIKTIAPYGLPHKAMKDSEIGGKLIPKGTAILFHYGAVHKDQNLWENPEKFMPERFLEQDGRLSDAPRMSQFVPFGIGRRSCVGEKLATEEIFMAVAGIFRRCRFTLVTPPKDMNAETVFFEMPKHYTVRATRLDN